MTGRGGRALAVLALTLGGCTASTDDAATPTGPPAVAPSASVAARLTAELDPAAARDYLLDISRSTDRLQVFRSESCVLQVLLVDSSLAAEDEATSVALATLGEVLGELTERPGVTLRVAGEELDAPARRATVATAEGPVAVQVAVRPLTGVRGTVTILHGCGDHEVTDVEFDTLVRQVSLTPAP